MARGRIMVAYIATDGGIDALRLAVALATGRDLAIDIVMARADGEVTPGYYPKMRGYDSILERQIAGWLDDARADVPEGIEVTTRVAVGQSVADTLIAQAEELGSELVVVGSQGGGIFKRVSLGSVVNTLLRSCPVPVAIAPKGYNHPGPVERVTALSDADRGCGRRWDVDTRVVSPGAQVEWLPGEIACIGASAGTATKILRNTPVPVVVTPNGYMNNT